MHSKTPRSLNIARRSLLDSPRAPPTPRTPGARFRSDVVPSTSLDDVKPVDGRINLNKLRLRSISGLKPHPKAEFLYLRDNCLSTLSNLPLFKNIKILDIGYNEISSLSFLESFPGLRQLYINSNHLTSLSDMPPLANLEHFSFSQNDVSTFEGMPTLPELRVLCASGNTISNFKGLPILNCLEVLRLVDNPISQSNNYRLLGCRVVDPKILRKIDGTNVSDEEQQIACSLPLKVSYCLRFGFIPSSIDNISESCDAFLLDLQQKDQPELLNILLVGETVEEQELRVESVVASRLLQDSTVSFTFQWSRYSQEDGRFIELPSAVSDSYMLTSYDVDTCVRVDVTANYSGSSTRVGKYFAVSNDVSSAPPCLSECSIVGSAVEGQTLTAQSRYSGGKQGGIRYSWLRSNKPIPGATGRTYMCRLEDIGHVISIEMIPIRIDGVEGSPVVSRMNCVVQAALPSVTDVYVEGPFIERELLTAHGSYFGGTEGNSIFQWFRVVEKHERTRQYVEIQDANTRFYTPTSADYGHKLVFQYTPVSNEGVPGTPVSVITQQIGAGNPSIAELAIAGELVEAKSVSVVHSYLGGIEGHSLIQWFCTTNTYDSDLTNLSNNDIQKLFSSLEEKDGRPSPSHWLVVSGATSREFVPKFDHVGRLLAVLYLPIRDDGMEGVPRVAMSRGIVSAGKPSIAGIEIHGVPEQGTELIAKFIYTGGRQGACKVSWFRVSKTNNTTVPNTELLLENSTIYAPVTDDVGSYIRAQVVPIRNDGLEGIAVFKDTETTVQYAKPRFYDVYLDGSAVEGNTITCEASYYGGIEGESQYTWLKIDSQTGDYSEISKKSKTLLITEALVGQCICCAVIPVRSDGLEGSQVISDPIGPVISQKPAIMNLDLIGTPLVGEVLSLENLQWTSNGTARIHVTWSRIVSEESIKIKEVTISPEDLSSSISHEITLDDVNNQIQASVVVERVEDGVKSVTFNARSEIINSLIPVISNFSLSPIPSTQRPIQPSYEYTCIDAEGESIYEWFIKSPISEEWVLVCKEKEFVPAVEHVEHFVRLKYQPVSVTNQIGQLISVDLPNPISWSCAFIQDANIVLNDSTNALNLHYTYVGPTGTTRVSWLRLSPSDDKEYPVSVEDYSDSNTISVYQLTPQDVGKRIRAIVTPISEASSSTTAAILTTSPLTSAIIQGSFIPADLSRAKLIDDVSISSLEMIGKFIEDSEISVVVNTTVPDVPYDFSWSLMDSKGVESVLKGVNELCFTPSLQHVGSTIKFTVVVNSQSFVVKSRPILAGTPTCTELILSGGETNAKPLTLKAFYKGGIAAQPKIKFYRVDKKGKRTEIEEARNAYRYVPTSDDINHSLLVEYTPVREDLVAGEPKTAQINNVELHPSFLQTTLAAVSAKEVVFPVIVHEGSSSEFGRPGDQKLILLNLEKLKVRLPSTKTIWKTAYSSSIKAHCVGENLVQIIFERGGPVLVLETVEKTQPRDLMLSCLRGFMYLASGRHPITGVSFEGIPTSDRALRKWVQNGSWASML
ncbi:hypothetical protein RCL1_003101 [Eukaryota sp. TZLM3-RCL]